MQQGHNSSLSNRVDVVIVGGVDLAVVSQRSQGLVKICLAQISLDDIPNVALVDELVCLGNLFHHLKDYLLAIACLLVEARVHSCCVIGRTTAYP